MEYDDDRKKKERINEPRESQTLIKETNLTHSSNI